MSLRVERRAGGVAVLTLDRPEKRNALSIALRRELAAALDDVAADARARCVVLTGAGTAFCSGMDHTEFGGDRAHREALVESSVAAFGALRRCPVPVVAAVNGPAVAGGFALALLCDLRIAAGAATFGFPELGRGIPPAYAAARAALPAHVARELCLTGRTVDARAALELGIAHDLHDDAAAAVARALALADAIAARPPDGVRATTRRIRLEIEHRCGPLFEEEERALRAALLD